MLLLIICLPLLLGTLLTGWSGARPSASHRGRTALIADTITRFKKGQPVLYCTWTPYWVSGVLRPGQDVVWLQVPFSSLPGEQCKLDTKLPNGKALR